MAYEVKDLAAISNHFGDNLVAVARSTEDDEKYTVRTSTIRENATHRGIFDHMVSVQYDGTIVTHETATLHDWNG